MPTHAPQPSRASVAGRRPGHTAVGRDPSTDGLAHLQATAGNGAVAQLLAANASPTLAMAAGNGALADALTVQRDGPKPEAKPDPKAERKAWQDAGLVGGGALYDLVNKDLSIEKLVEMALPELAGLASSGAQAGFDEATKDNEKKGEVKEVGLDSKEVKQVADATTTWAQKAAQKWLDSGDGKKFLAKAQGLVNTNPKAAYWTIVGVMAAAIGGAVGAYFGNLVDPPEFKKAFEVKGVKIDAAVDLGKFRERILQSAKLAASTKAGPGEAGIEGTAKSVSDKGGNQGYDLGVGGTYTLGAAKLTGGYGYNTLTDQSSGNIGFGYKTQPLTLGTTFKLSQDGTGTLDTSFVGKLGQDTTFSAGAAGGLYGPGAAKSPMTFKLSLGTEHGKESDKVTASLSPTTNSVTFGTEQTRLLYGGVFGMSMTGGTTGQSVGASYVRDALRADIKYTVDQKGAEAVEGSVTGKADGAEAGATLKYGLTTGQLEKLTTHLGFTTADQTLTFLNDIAIEVGKGSVSAKVTGAMKLRLKTIAAEVEGSLTTKEGADTGASAHAGLGWKLPKGFTMGSGFGASYAPTKDKPVTPWMLGPEVSIGHEALPIRLVGGVSIPVGPGSEGLPPVFGMSVAPAFDFLGGDTGKKKGK
jgi:hypothetical protein